MSNQFQIEAAVKSDVGRKRPHNEDNVYPSEAQVPPGAIEVGSRGALFIVADGLGGYAAGEVASQMAIETIVNYCLAAAPDGSNAPQVLRAAIQEASRRIYSMAQGDVNKAHMGSTCVAVFLVDGRAFIANVGDSRSYVVRERHVTQVTDDHSLVAEQVRQKIITPDQARAARQRNVITRCLGHGEEVEVDIFSCQLAPGDVVLLCSDGLHGQLTDEQIESILSTLPPGQAVAQLVESANAAGGPDNISAIAVRIRSVPQQVPNTGDRGGAINDETTDPRLPIVWGGDQDGSELPTRPLQALAPEMKAMMEAMTTQAQQPPPEPAQPGPLTPPGPPPEPVQLAQPATPSHQKYHPNPEPLPPSNSGEPTVGAALYAPDEAPFASHPAALHPAPGAAPLQMEAYPDSATQPLAVSGIGSPLPAQEPHPHSPRPAVSELAGGALSRDQGSSPPAPAILGAPQRIIPFPGNWVGEGTAIGRQLGPYTLLRRIGGGNTGEVYEAQKEVPDKLYAVKILREDPTYDEAFMARFTREAKLVAKLDHPNVVRLSGVYVKGSLLYMVMPLVRGKSLQARLDSLGSYPYSPEEVGSYVRQIMRALQHAHDNEVIHGDLKPTNILIRDDGMILVSDFGLVRAIQGEALTKNHIASPFYMAPELIRGKAEKRSDIYSLGSLVYQLLAGRPPFIGEDVLTQHLSSPPPSLREYNPLIAPELEKVVFKALEKRPENRFKTPKEFAEAYLTTIGRRI